MVEYGPEVIQEFAEKLYAQARWVALKFAVVGVTIGLGLAYLLGVFAHTEAVGVLMILAVVLPGWIAGSMGWRKAFDLRFQAQSVLLQKRIEENTRPLKG